MVRVYNDDIQGLLICFWLRKRDVKRHARFSEPAQLQGTSLPPIVVYLATASLTVFLQVRGVLRLFCCGRQTFTCCLAVLMLRSLRMQNSNFACLRWI